MVTIGGGQYGVGQSYVDELNRQRQLAFQQQQLAQQTDEANQRANSQAAQARAQQGIEQMRLQAETERLGRQQALQQQFHADEQQHQQAVLDQGAQLRGDALQQQDRQFGENQAARLAHDKAVAEARADALKQQSDEKTATESRLKEQFALQNDPEYQNHVRQALIASEAGQHDAAAQETAAASAIAARIHSQFHGGSAANPNASTAFPKESTGYPPDNGPMEFDHTEYGPDGSSMPAYRPKPVSYSPPTAQEATSQPSLFEQFQAGERTRKMTEKSGQQQRLADELALERQRLAGTEENRKYMRDEKLRTEEEKETKGMAATQTVLQDIDEEGSALSPADAHQYLKFKLAQHGEHLPDDWERNPMLKAEVMNAAKAFEAKAADKLGYTPKTPDQLRDIGIDEWTKDQAKRLSTLHGEGIKVPIVRAAIRKVLENYKAPEASSGGTVRSVIRKALGIADKPEAQTTSPTANSPAQPTPAQPATAPVVIRTQKEYIDLKSGTPYVDTNGKPGIKP